MIMRAESHDAMILTGKQNNWEKNMSHCHVVYHKSHMD
jgi:hypothetical protein